MKRVVIYLATAALLVLTSAAAAMAQEVAVVVNKSNPTDTVSMVELRKILLGQETQWPSGKKTIAALMTQAERPATLKAVCAMNENDYNVHLMHATFNGDSGEPPKVLGSASQVKLGVAGLAGAGG